MSIREAATFGSEAVAGRGADFAVWVEGHEIPPAQIIGEDQDDIRARREALGDDRKRDEEERKQGESANFAIHPSFSVETVQEMKEREIQPCSPDSRSPAERLDCRADRPIRGRHPMRNGPGEAQSFGFSRGGGGFTGGRGVPLPGSGGLGISK